MIVSQPCSAVSFFKRDARCGEPFTKTITDLGVAQPGQGRIDTAFLQVSTLDTDPVRRRQVLGDALRALAPANA